MTRFLLFVVLCIIFGSCIKEVVIEEMQEPLIVVNCVLTYEPQQELRLVYTKSIGGGVFYNPVTDATIELWGNGALIGLFSFQSSDRWMIDYYPEPLMEYQLVVKIPHTPLITATTTMPQNPDITYLGGEDHIKQFMQNTQPYPQWAFILNTGTDFEPWFAPHSVPEINSTNTLRFDDLATNHPYVDMFNGTGFMLIDLGDKATMPGYDGYLRLIPHSDSVHFEIETFPIDLFFIVFRSCSFEYDSYMKSIFSKVMSFRSEDDIFYWFDEDQVYSNIENGVGVFGACTDQAFPIKPPIEYLP